MTYERTIGLSGHPVAQGGWAWTHVYVLFEKIGYGPHLCHWCRSKLLAWRRGGSGLHADHVDGDVTNNSPENLVPSCVSCNTWRSGKAFAWSQSDEGRAALKRGLRNMSDDARRRQREAQSRGGKNTKQQIGEKIKNLPRTPCDRCGRMFQPAGHGKHRKTCK